MTKPDLSQLEMLARVDEVVERLTEWAEPASPWEPMNQCRAMIRRLLARAESLRIRLEAPLVVATFGGTGTGKSSLVNALVGQECTPTGRERPTTSKPVLIAHPDTDVDSLGMPADGFDVIRADAPILREMVIVDCPDPDTSETETPGSNLQLLHRLLPHCDVLIYTSTQQKYRSARVTEELGQAAAGCRLLFVQTHAELDEDIRDDWRDRLAGHYEIPEMFFVDSLRALQEQASEQRPSGDFARLYDLVTTQLSSSERVQIRRANLVDLLHAALQHCRSLLADGTPGLEQLDAALAEQRAKLTTRMADRLGSELLTSRSLWERRLISAVTEIWGFSPFSSLLRIYNGMGNLIASMTLFRARSSAQMALIGTLQGARWFKSRREEKEAAGQLERIGRCGLEDDLLRESQFVVAGYVQSARLDPRLVDQASLENLREEATRVEDQFLGDAGRRIDGIIEQLAIKSSRLLIRALYEILLALYVGFVLFRIGKNFFYDTFLKELLTTSPVEPIELLSVDFYIGAGIFFLLWSGILVMAFTGRLRWGLRNRIEKLAHELAQGQMTRGLFPGLEQTCREIELQRTRLDSIADGVSNLRSRIAKTTGLGAAIAPLAAR